MNLIARSLFVSFLMLSCITISAQTQKIKTKDGTVRITPILHASMVLEWNDKTVFIDPYGGADRYTSFNDPDYVIITHAHGDHLNKETLEGLNLENVDMIAPQSVVDQLGPIPMKRISKLDNGQDTDKEGMNIMAVPMYNLPDDETSRHKPGWGNGYVITIGDTRFYISGDTEDIDEMRALENIDYAFVCMNLPYTMTVEQAADAVLEFKPKVVYPFHYRGQDGFSDVDKFKEMVSVEKSVEVRLLDWYPER